MAKLEIYKRNQGKYTRISTFAAIVVIGAIGAVILGQQLKAWLGITLLEYAVPVVLIVAVTALMFWIVNRPSTADFLIATEGEMKKVSWSSRREIIGSTKVVIVTTVILAMLLFGVDMAFAIFFERIGVM